MSSRRSTWSILRGTAENWLADQASSISAALAFYCAFSLAPLLIIIVTIAGWIVGDKLAYSYLDTQVTLLFGSQSAKLILQAMDSARSEEGTWATVVSVVMLLVGASTVFAALESALQQVWGGRDAVRRGWRAFGCISKARSGSVRTSVCSRSIATATRGCSVTRPSSGRATFTRRGRR